MELLNENNIENICKYIYNDLKKNDIYKTFDLDYFDIIIMSYEFKCELYYNKDGKQLNSSYKPILVKNQKYFKYDFISEDSINILNNIELNKYYNFDRNYKLHCYIKKIYNNNLNLYLPTFIMAIEYNTKRLCSYL